MFDQRIKSVLVILGCAAAVMLARSAWLQIAGGAVARRTLERTRRDRVVTLEPVRGKITDRQGTVLARPVPCWDVCIHYGVITGEKKYLERLARNHLRRQDVLEPTPDQQADARRTIDGRIRRTWEVLGEIEATRSGSSTVDLADRRNQVRRRVEGIKSWLERLTERDQRVGEQDAFHPIVSGLDRTAMSEATASVDGYPWVRIRSRARRRYDDAEPFAHVLGRLSPVRRKHMGPDVDPNYGDELAEYREHDRIGIGGAEAWFEQRLRGRRGRVIERPDGSRSRLEPVAGQDVALTLDGTLQRRIYALLRETVETLNRAGSRNKPYQPCPGAAAVLLYMPPHQPGTPPRREALAVVSYPSYDPATYGDEYQELVRETWTLPLTSRAVDQPYPPGSTVKPMVLAAALTEGLTTRDRRIPCNGIFGSRNPRRCWIVFRNMTQHRDLPTLDAEMSLAQSCNSYYYTIGSQLGTDRLWTWFNKFGIGNSNRSRTRRGGSALNLTIGQGLVDATPLQVANMIATVATGWYVPVSFRLGPESAGAESAVRPLTRDAAHAAGERGAFVASQGRLDVRDEHWRLVRKGLWQVVNGAHGTARNYARLDSEAYELCGKTGTAQSWSRAVEYAFHCTFADGRKETIFATDQYSALQRVTTHDPPTITPGGARRKYPPSPSPPHAWFVGYIQPKGAPPSQPPHVALAVILEYAGSGSRQAAPVAKSIAELVIERGRDYVTGTAPSGREGR